MSQLPDMDWSRLPDDPVGFFGLPNGFTRKDLKRGYTRLIKHFKPERSPDEFKRIRSAYEVLEDSLRYGQTDLGLPGQGLPNQGDSTSPGPQPADEIAPALDARALIQQHGAEEARERLRASAGADPSAWVAIALIDDALARTESSPFDALLEASKVTSGHPIIHKALSQFLRSDMPIAKAVKVLQLIARAAQSSRKARGASSPLAEGYWYLTGAQWLMLARELPPESFEMLIRAVEPLVGEEGYSGRIMLGLRLRRIMAFKASDAWIGELDEDLEEAYQALPDWTDEEFEFNRMLDAYREARPIVLDGGGLRTTIDEAIHDIVELDTDDADRAFIALNLELMDRRDELLDEFDSDGPESQILALILHAYGTEWRERRGIEVADVGEVDQRRIQEFARRIDKRGENTWAGRAWTYSIVLIGLVLVALLVAIGSYAAQQLGPVGWGIPGVAAVAIFIGFKQGWAFGPIQLMSSFFAPRVHRRVWRPEAAAFMAEMRLPHEALVKGLRAITTNDAVLTTDAIENDLGLHIYGQAMLAIDD